MTLGTLLLPPGRVFFFRWARGCWASPACSPFPQVSGMALTVDVVGPAPWGFRISGGRDFHMPIVVTRVRLGCRRKRWQRGLPKSQDMPCEPCKKPFWAGSCCCWLGPVGRKGCGLAPTGSNESPREFWPRPPPLPTPGPQSWECLQELSRREAGADCMYFLKFHLVGGGQDRSVHGVCEGSVLFGR